MSAATLAAMLLFNASVVEYGASAAPDKRVFLGAQPGEGDAYAWTKCLPESRVYVIQVAAKTLQDTPEKVRFAAAHEVAHIVLHGALICDQERLRSLPTVRRKEMETEADRCAALIMAGGGC